MDSEKPKGRRLSRQERREAFLQTAGQLFFEKGFARTSLDEVVQRAGGSKRNLYEEFGGKEDMLLALVEGYAGRMTASLQELEAGADIEQTLLCFGTGLLRLLMSPFMLGASQAAMEASFSSPAIADAYFTSGPRRGQNYVEAALRLAREKGEIRLEDCELGANIFLGMLRNNTHLEALIKLRPGLAEEEIQRTVRLAVDIFLRGIQAGR